MSKKEDNKWPLPFSKPEEVGFSSERLACIRPGLQKFIDKQRVPNLVTLVARHGKIVHYDAQGYIDLESKKPASKDTIFRLYSNSKPIAGLATMICVEDGLLALDDPVSKYIPAFKNPKVLASNTAGQSQSGPPFGLPTVPAKREITIRDCLRNTTGLATPQRFPSSLMMQLRDIIAESGWDLMELDKPPRESFREMVEAHARLPLSFEPGTEFEYHMGYAVIGVIIEEITGKTLEEFYQERIFKPLEMKDTSFYLDKKTLDRFSSCYQPKYEKKGWSLTVYDRAETSEKLKGPKIHFGTGGNMGGLLSTVADYARFAQMLLNNGELDGVRLLGRKSVELMTSNHTGNILVPMFGPGFGFGIGTGVYLGGSPRPIMRSVGTYGWGGAAGTTFFADPREDLIAVCFTQLFMGMMMPDNNYQDEFERLVYQSLI
jgi:CubicO group peptidase (beta-lactamase class C family)